MASVKHLALAEKVGVVEPGVMAGPSGEAQGGVRADEFYSRRLRMQNGSGSAPGSSSKADGHPAHANGTPSVPRMGVRARVSEWPPKKDFDEEPGKAPWDARPATAPYDNVPPRAFPTSPPRTSPTSSSRSAQGTPVRRSRDDGGSPDAADCYHSAASPQKAAHPPQRQRSNSDVTLADLDLNVISVSANSGMGSLHREYGSTSSIDKQGGSYGVAAEGYSSLLRGYRADDCQDSSVAFPGPSLADWPMLVQDLDKSPALLLKEREKSLKRRSRSDTGDSSIFRKLRNRVDGESASEKSSDQEDGRSEDGSKPPWVCQKCFAHYDVQSILFDLNEAAANRHQLGRRVNTTTGASAASQPPRALGALAACPGGGGGGSSGSIAGTGGSPSGSTEDLNGRECPDPDTGDGKSCELLHSCPYFRNEVGGEGERRIGLTRSGGGGPVPGAGGSAADGASSSFEWSLSSHCTNAGVSVLEVPRESQAVHCEKVKRYIIEHIDLGAYCYRKHFHGKDHQNYFGVDENLGPVAVSVRREKIDEGREKESSHGPQYLYRVVFRTSELRTLRGAVLEDAVPSTARHGTTRGLPLKEVMEFVLPELQLSCLRLAPATPRVSEQLLKLDEQGLSYQHKVGIMYCKAGQSTEEEMYNNETAEAAFDEFLDLLGERVRLKGFTKYRAQLDNKTDSTGMHSLYTTYKDYEIMFHVSSMLPYTPNNRQQLLRKRHIGNDIVTIVFQEPGALPFTPKNIRSHFQHVFVIVRVHNPGSENVCYSVAVTRSKDVPPFGPPIPKGVTFPKSAVFRDFLLAKVINGENAAHKSDKFRAMAARTRQEYLRDLAENHVTTGTVESAARSFGFIPLGGKRKERTRPRLGAELGSQGALVWHARAHDYSHSAAHPELGCLLGISNQVVVLVDRVARSGVVFNCTTRDVIGWTSSQNALRIYYERGECIDLTVAPDEVVEIVQRLQLVTRGCETRELTLRRNGLGQLGFHVNYEGVVADVEQYGFAWQAGLRQGSRLVEICKVAVATLSHEQMIDLLRTSVTVRVVIIPPHDDGSPRRGCSEHCRVPMMEYKFGEAGAPFDVNRTPFKAPVWQRATPTAGSAPSPTSGHAPGTRKGPSATGSSPRQQPPLLAQHPSTLPPHHSQALSPMQAQPPHGLILSAQGQGAIPRSFSVDGKAAESGKRGVTAVDGRPVGAERHAPHRGSPCALTTPGDAGPSRRQRPAHDGQKMPASVCQDAVDTEMSVDGGTRSRSGTLEREKPKSIEPMWHVPAGKVPSSYRDSPTRRVSRQDANGRDSPGRAAQAVEHRYSSHSSSNTLSSTGSSCASDDRWFHPSDGAPSDRDAASGGGGGGGAVAVSITSQQLTAPGTSTDSGIDTATPRGTPLASGHASARAARGDGSGAHRAAGERAHRGGGRDDRGTARSHGSPLHSGSPSNIPSQSSSSRHAGSSPGTRARSKSSLGEEGRGVGGVGPPFYPRQGASGSYLRGWKKPESPNSSENRRRLGSDVSDTVSWARQRATATARSLRKAEAEAASDGIPELMSPHGRMHVRDELSLEQTPALARRRLQRTHSDESLCRRDGCVGGARDSLLEQAAPAGDYLLPPGFPAGHAPPPSHAVLPACRMSGLSVDSSGSEESLPRLAVRDVEELLPLPDAAAGLEWATLVDAARAFEELSYTLFVEDQRVTSVLGGMLDVDDMGCIAELAEGDQADVHLPSASLVGDDSPKSLTVKVGQLESILKQLQEDLQKEKTDKAALQAELEDLREDNVRLQQESQTAATQLRKFTEWFFNAIDKK
ncbi:signal-induced proliferation-associated 1-like protein 2 isoform X1 [Lethenteron reissneri]|uniref:signal-induced proliferation-associated 1-like protein 2 isoform X1 n=1 Tax=Lethenteron reissneri TaxID=7753 RepID=UPI002AB65E0D|nr:signal-induced proliferation-associated 1-like protein 2 isoform X1 [Lethenteron reissneri]XP_061414960.1 signal-induced proliferation-associated 1-like protein 2 isoform X1 [Lethenteron reissneri]XP_061414961.1 signal-induced proliferation-associated 1-like protein 2 isoform X1 [Lethenteron reissneri]